MGSPLRYIWSIQEKDAVAEVFHQFPERFARQFKGKGHEVCMSMFSLANIHQSAPAARHFFPDHVKKPCDVYR